MKFSDIYNFVYICYVIWDCIVKSAIRLPEKLIAV